ncbi:MAG: hypothetical protein KFF49_01165 [Bacteroidales bacterium]|nr:hypothetical protein [Bacteroidales bacterium]
MSRTPVFLTLVLLAICIPSTSQSLFDNIPGKTGSSYKTGGFIRSGIYINKPEKSPGIPVSFADFSLNAEAGDGSSYKAYADVRYRYASEYGKGINSPSLREAWAAWYTPYTEIRAGKQIVKWSNMDFFRLQDLAFPRNELYRSFEPADKDLGNVVLSLSLKPSDIISLSALLIPRFRSSVLYTEFMDIPDIVEISDYSRKKYTSLSYGLKAEIFLRNFSANISFYDAYHPLPGLGLDSLSMSAGSTKPVVSISEKPFSIQALSAGLEFMPGNNILRMEAAWTRPDQDYRQNENIILPEVQWVAGIEHFFGQLRVILEYSGKYLLDYEEPVFDPTLPDESMLADLATIPPEQAFEFTRLQIASFNRLYTYQLDEYSHYAGLHLSYEKGMATLSPALNILYSITAEEYLLMPELKIKPADNIKIVAGATIYKGKTNSLFDMINNKLNSIYTGIRIDF